VKWLMCIDVHFEQWQLTLSCSATNVVHLRYCDQKVFPVIFLMIWFCCLCWTQLLLYVLLSCSICD